MASPAYDPKEARYWDPEDLVADQRRQFDVCHGCRLCWNLCPAFPALFDLTDKLEAERADLTRENLAPVEDLCFQCKLCWVVCPYTGPHEYDLDVPRLIQRSKFVKAKEQGIPRSKRLVADQDRLAKLSGGPMAPMTNLANKLRPARKIVAMIADVHPDAILPTYATQSFTSWFRKKYGDVMRPPGEPVRKVAFFASCTVDYNETQIGKAAIQVLEHNNVEVVVPDVQCCGMPLIDAGDFAGAKKKMDHNLARLSALVEDGYDIVVAQPTCALVVKDEYPRNSAEAEAAKKVSEHTFEIGHFLTRMARDKVLLRDFQRELGDIAFHVACHNRAMSTGNNSVRLLGIIPGTTVKATESCSGHDGSWGVSKQYFPMSLQVGKKLFDNMKEGSPDLMISDCPLAAHHIEVGTGRRPIHTVQALALAYGLDGGKGAK